MAVRWRGHMRVPYPAQPTGCWEKCTQQGGSNLHLWNLDVCQFAPSKILSQELGWSAIRHYHLALLLQCCEQLGVHLRPWAIESPWSSRALGAKFLQGCFGRIVDIDINCLLPNAKLFATKHATENWEVARSGLEADLQASLPLISDQDQNFGSSQLLAPMLQHAFRETPTHQVDAVWGPSSIPGTFAIPELLKALPPLVFWRAQKFNGRSGESILCCGVRKVLNSKLMQSRLCMSHWRSHSPKQNAQRNLICAKLLAICDCFAATMQNNQNVWEGTVDRTRTQRQPEVFFYFPSLETFFMQQLSHVCAFGPLIVQLLRKILPFVNQENISNIFSENISQHAHLCPWPT